MSKANNQLEPEHLTSKLQDILDDDSGSLFKESSEDSYNPANFGRSKSKKDKGNEEYPQHNYQPPISNPGANQYNVQNYESFGGKLHQNQQMASESHQQSYSLNHQKPGGFVNRPAPIKEPKESDYLQNVHKDPVRSRKVIDDENIPIPAATQQKQGFSPVKPLSTPNISGGMTNDFTKHLPTHSNYQVSSLCKPLFMSEIEH